MMLFATTVAVVGVPVWMPAAALFDLVRGKRRLPTVRAGRFALRYLLNDSAEILLAPFLWLGARTGSARGIERYRSVQRWSIRSLTAAADRDVGVRIDPTATAPVEPHSGPYIVLCRHTSMLDSSVASLLFGLDSPWNIRSIATADALADPGFDLIYPPLGTVFIDRDEGASARRVIAGFSRFDGPDDIVTIFPEGQLFRTSALARSLDRLSERHPERAERLGGLRHVLPPRPGGTMALLDALPDADVLVIGHQGFERAASIPEMARNAPLDTTVQLSIRHVSRSDVPESTGDRIAWLDHLWLDLDDWVAATNSSRLPTYG